MIQYLTGVSTPTVRKVAHEVGLGLLATPDNSYHLQVDEFPAWAIDNACFNHPERFKMAAFLRYLEAFTPRQRRACLFANAPDVVGNAAATLERSAPALPAIRKLGFKAALVAQDGLEALEVPWDTFDVLFIGGSTEWKLSDHARELTRRALEEGKRVHMGRVNSYKRLRIAHDFGCHTVDGTFIKFAPAVNLPRLLAWFTKLRAELEAKA